MAPTGANNMFPRSPIKKSLTATSRKKRQALADRHNINKYPQAALQSISNGKIDEIEDNLVIIQEHFEGIEDYLSATIEPAFYNVWRRPDSTIAEKVSAIPELLKSILSNLKLSEIINCYGINRTFRGTIERSPKLQTKIFLRDAPTVSNGCYKQCALDVRTKAFKNWGTRSNYNARIVVHKSHNYALPIIGPRWREMLVRQPSLPTISFFFRCGDDDCPMNGAQTYTDLDGKGVTLGNLWEMAEQVTKFHCDCAGDRSVVRFEAKEEKDDSEV